MTALATKVRAVDYKRLSLSALREMAAQAHPLHTDDAAREYVERLVDLELERRLDLLHRRPGWHPCSPGMGDGTGKSSVPCDAMYLAYIKGIPNSVWHDRARVMVGRLPERRAIALMIQAAKSDHRLGGEWGATHDQIAEIVGHYAQLLGWPPGVKVMRWFKNGQAIKWAAHTAKAELILQVKSGA